MIRLNWFQKLLQAFGFLIVKTEIKNVPVIKEVVKEVVKEVPVIKYIDRPVEVIKEVPIENELDIKYTTDFNLNKNLIKDFQIQYGDDEIYFNVEGIDKYTFIVTTYCIRNNKKYKVQLSSKNHDIKYLKNYKYELKLK